MENHSSRKNRKVRFIIIEREANISDMNLMMMNFYLKNTFEVEKNTKIEDEKNIEILGYNILF